MLIAILIPLFSFSAQANQFSDFQGIWKQECQGAKQKQEEFQGDIVTLTENYFSAINCQGEKTLSFFSSGSYSLPNSQRSEGILPMDFTFQKVEVIAWREKTVEIYNQVKMCERDDWRVGEKQDITGRLCEIYIPGKLIRAPQAGDKRFGIYMLEENDLYFGKLSSKENGLSPDKRPSQLEAFPFTRQ
jgi:hypothetical protein